MNNEFSQAVCLIVYMVLAYIVAFYAWADGKREGFAKGWKARSDYEAGRSEPQDRKYRDARGPEKKEV